jgi:hypothetical protein
MPNYTSVAQVLINSVPSAPFSMDWIPSMGHPNQQLADALKRLSAAKYGRPRAIVEAEIAGRLQAADIAREEDKKKRLEAMRNSSVPIPGRAQSATPGGQATLTPSGSASAPPSPAGGSSFLDEWLAKRQQVKPQAPPSARPQPPTPLPQTPPSATALPQSPPSQPLPISAPKPTPAPEPAPVAPAVKSEAEIEAEISKELRIARSQAISEMEEKKIVQNDVNAANANNELVLSGDGADEIFIDVRGNIHQGNED